MSLGFFFELYILSDNTKTSKKTIRKESKKYFYSIRSDFIIKCSMHQPDFNYLTAAEKI